MQELEAWKVNFKLSKEQGGEADGYAYYEDIFGGHHFYLHPQEGRNSEAKNCQACDTLERELLKSLPGFKESRFKDGARREIELLNLRSLVSQEFPLELEKAYQRWRELGALIELFFRAKAEGWFMVSTLTNVFLLQDELQKKRLELGMKLANDNQSRNDFEELLRAKAEKLDGLAWVNCWELRLSDRIMINHLWPHSQKVIKGLSRNIIPLIFAKELLGPADFEKSVFLLEANDNEKIFETAEVLLGDEIEANNFMTEVFKGSELINDLLKRARALENSD